MSQSAFLAVDNYVSELLYNALKKNYTECDNIISKL